METLVKIPKIDPNQINDYLIAKTANEWIEDAKLMPIPKMLFSELWHEGEVCICFGTPDAGKTSLGYQLGDSISKGERIPGFKMEAKAQIVLYCDLENSVKQFEHRFSEDYLNHYIFDEKFIRIEINSDAEWDNKISGEDFLMSSIERCITQYGAKILIVDNITYLKAENEKAKDAGSLMIRLKKLKKKYDLSLLVMAHTPKRDSTRPITRNDLAGSSVLMNLCTSSFAIGTSISDSSLRYIKQIKQKFTENIYGEDNVMICQIEKNVNRLQFTFLRHGKECNYLSNLSEAEKSAIEEMVKERHRIGKSGREIAKELNLSYSKVQRILKKRG